MQTELTFFEGGMRLIKGNGDLRLAIGELIQLAAEDGNGGAGSLFIVDWHGLARASFEAVRDLGAAGGVGGSLRRYPNRRSVLRPSRATSQALVSHMLTDPLFAPAREAA